MIDTTTLVPVSRLQPLEVLYEAREFAPDLPQRLQALYAGPLGIMPGVYANFVATLDGVVALPDVLGSNPIISGDNPADRFVMGLLRATADVVLIGSGTFRSSPHGRWTAESAYPPAAAAYAELRHHRAKTPLLVVLTGSGDINPAHPVLEEGALILTTERGAAALRGRLPSASTVLSLGEGARPDPVKAVGALRRQGHTHILSEAGPHVFGALLGAGLVNELFLTSSPFLAGGSAEGNVFHLIEAIRLLPEARIEGQLLSVRRHGAHLFLRYAFTRHQ